MQNKKSVNLDVKRTDCENPSVQNSVTLQKLDFVTEIMDSTTLPQIIKSDKSEQTRNGSYDCIALDDVRKLDSLLTQCESISCDNLWQHQELFYQEPTRPERRCSSTSALNEIVSENYKRRQTCKKLNVFHQNDGKLIIPFVENKFNNKTSYVEPGKELANFCSLQLRVESLDDKSLIAKCRMCSETKKHTYNTKETESLISKSVINKKNGNQCFCETSLMIVSDHSIPIKRNLRHEQENQDQDTLAMVCGRNNCSDNINTNQSNDSKRIPLNLSNMQISSSKNNQNDTKSNHSETLARKVMSFKYWRVNAEDDGAGGVKESLLGLRRSADKKMPEQVETVSLHPNTYSFFQFLDEF